MMFCQILPESPFPELITMKHAHSSVRLCPLKLTKDPNEHVWALHDF